MWSVKLINEARGENELKAVPRDSGFLKAIEVVRRDTKIWSKYIDSGYREFFDSVMCNKDLLLWIQRRFLSTSSLFKEELFRLDDTDVPFDWDHISPNNLVKGKQNLPDPLRDIYQQPCNLRAWPYRLNRADQDNVPASKLAVDEMEEGSLLRSTLSGLDDKQINAYLLENSFCERGWKDFSDEWLQGSKISERHWSGVYALIYKRWKNMYQELSRELLLKDLAVK